MKGIQFVIGEKGEKTAVLIDLSEWGEIWEDIYDVLVSQARKDEPSIPWEDPKAEMNQHVSGDILDEPITGNRSER